ncbi:TetR/AcrR family transcriptional regulator [Psychromonas sp. MME2]|uniref:TetR/AcrR family transcriptional regulator n=1 Tax=unclassified Psychromonas TaxID=2614957 RepID=UPI00339CEDB8
MANKKFDADIVLEQALATFWRYGFYGTTIPQLVKATTLRPGSLYREFGNKEALYKRALSRYTEKTIDNINQVISESSDVLEGVLKILKGLQTSANSDSYCGCFLIKSQLELSAHNPKVSAYVSTELARIEENYKCQLMHFFTSAQSKLYAKQLMIVIFGLRVDGYQKNQLENSEELLLGLLPWLGNEYQCY